MSIVFYNSEYIDSNDVKISPENRSLNYGDGFFESIKIINSKPFNFSAHFNRFTLACKTLKMNNEFSKKEIVLIIEQLINKNEIINGTLKMHVSRIEGGKYCPKSLAMYLLISTSEGDIFVLNNKQSLCFYNEDVKSKGKLSNIKSANALVSVMSSIYARENNFDNAILFNTDANIIECSNSNIFIVKEDVIYTPPVRDGCVSGTLRGWVLNNEIVIEKSLSKKEILNADEIFITNAVSGIIPVKKVEETEFFTFKLSTKLQIVLISQS
jgi:branched-chain amino acid aminotransferase